jgi:protease-4
MWHEVERAKLAGKPVVVSMGDYAASGGYYISANADWIVAQPGTLTGSIGVFGGKFNLAGTYDKLGLHQTDFKRGEMADLLSTSEPFSEAGRAAFRSYIEDFYGVFVGKVADGRKLDRETVHAVAQGRVWTGEQALEHRLVDQLGGLDDAIAKAADLAQVTDYGVQRWPEQKSFFDLLMEDLAKASAPTVRIDIPLVPGAEAALREVQLIEALGGGSGVLAYLPGHLTIE